MYRKIAAKIISPRALMLSVWTRASRYIKSDELYLVVIYYLKMGRRLNLSSPKSFTEKIQYLKLRNNSDICTTMVDKYEVRKLIRERIGERYLIPLLGVWSSFDEINFEHLPSQFVLKTTHDSDSIVICRDKSTFDFGYAKRRLGRSLRRNYFYAGREYPYKGVKPRIIAEKYMVDTTCGELKDYKFFCFSGEPKILFIASNRFVKPYADFTYYDTSLNRLPFSSQGHEIDLRAPKIENLDKMINLARVLSTGFAHLRVDLYNIDGRIYFGEFTFHHNGGLVAFEPEEWDRVLGDMIAL